MIKQLSRYEVQDIAVRNQTLEEVFCVITRRKSDEYTIVKREIKSNYKILLLFMGIVTLYSGIITAMYDPEVGTGINAMAESMPEFFAAFGMENPGVTLLDF